MHVVGFAHGAAWGLACGPQGPERGERSCLDAPFLLEASAAAGGRGRTWRPRPLPSQGRGDTMVVHPFVRRSCALIRGGPVRRHRAKLSLERLGSPVAQLWDCVPLSCARAAETTLFAGSIPSRGPLQYWILPGRAACPAGAQRHFRCSFAPRVQRPSNRAYQWGHPAARPATVSSLNRSSVPACAVDASGAACGNC